MSSASRRPATYSRQVGCSGSKSRPSPSRTQRLVYSSNVRSSGSPDSAMTVWANCSWRSKNALPYIRRIAQRGAGQDSSGIEDGKHRIRRADEQGELRAGERDRVAAAVPALGDDPAEVRARRVGEAAIHQLVERQRVDPLSILATRDLVLDPPRPELGRVDAALHEIPSAEH